MSPVTVTSNLTQIESILAQLDRPLRAYAHTFRTPGLDADDLYQDMVIAICEKAATSPTFLDQKPGYILRFAKYAAMHSMTRQYRYNTRCESEPEPADEDSEVWVETISDPNESPEEQAEREIGLAKLMEALRRAGLNNREVQIVETITLGYNQVETAQQLDITAQTVNWYLGRIAVKLDAIEDDQLADMLHSRELVLA